MLIDPVALRKLVDIQQFSELKDKAQFCLELDETYYAAWPLLALACAHLGEREASESATLKAEHYLADDLLDIDAQIDLAGLYCLLFRVDDAVALLEPALLSDVDNSLAMARLAWCRLFIGEVADARELYERSIELNRRRLPVWLGLCRIYLELNDYDLAQATLDDAIAQYGEQFEALPELTAEQFAQQFRGLQLNIWVKADKLASAEEWLEQRQTSLDEDDWAGLVGQYAQLLAAKGTYDLAEDVLKEALKHYPDNLALMMTLAELAQLLGRVPQAAQLYRRAIATAEKQDKPVVAYWVRLSSVLLHRDDERARHAAEKVVSLVDDMQEGDELSAEQIQIFELQAKNALAQVESQEQNFDKARALFEDVLESNAYFLPALQGLGQMAMQQGSIDEAIALFERVKAIDPAKGYSSLINARQFPDDDVVLNRLENLARQESMEGPVQSGLLLQVATAWEKRKVYDKAFELARDANEASKRLLDYDPIEHRADCARIRYVFSKALFEHRADYDLDSSLPVFVLGMPRSGTTLVEQILAGHSAIFGAGELGVIPSRIQGLNRWERHVGSGRSYPDCVDDISPKVRKGIAEGIITELKGLAENDKPNALHVVDKLPHNFENIGMIKFFFPNARIISVRRDPRDIALSNYFTDYQAKHGGMGFAYDLTWVGEQLADHNMFMHHWHEVFSGEILEINYEDVVADTEAMARKMLDYIGVNWEPEVLNFNKLDRPVKTASVWQVRQPIYKTAMAKWKHYQDYLAPLIKGTNAKITFEPISGRVVLPEPGLLQAGVALYNDEKLDEAEYEFKKLLHHVPDHAAANVMVGLVYALKGHLSEAAELVEKGLELCPWNQKWKSDLIQLYELLGETEKLTELNAKYKDPESSVEEDDVLADKNIEFKQNKVSLINEV